jgi:probable HAF family extracellular repeat protein
MDSSVNTLTYINFINSKGQMAGYALPNNTQKTAILWNSANPLDYVLVGNNKNIPSNIGTFGLDVNESGQVLLSGIGTNGVWFSALYTDENNVKLLPIFQGWTDVSATRMNDLGQIVGVASDASNKAHAILWDKDGSIIDLNAIAAASGWYLTSANGINNEGQIITQGHMLDANGHAMAAQAVLLSPTPTPITSQVNVATTGLIYSRASKHFTGTMTVTNISQSAITGTLVVQLNNLASGVTLVNATGTSNGTPYINQAASLNPGASISIPLVFSDPSTVLITFDTTIGLQ